MRYENLGHHPRDEQLSVTFDNCDAGWIHCRVLRSCGSVSEAIVIRCSACFDPLPALIEWLEAIARGADEASWIVNEEGCFVRLRATRSRDRIVLHCEEKPDHDPAATWKERMTLRVRAVHIVSWVYSALHQFAGSPAFRPEEWCIRRRYDLWTHHFPEDRVVPVEQLAARLAEWRRDELLAILFYTFPNFLNDLPQVPALPADWETLAELARQSALCRLLNEPVSGFGGADPRAMKSELIESWLAAHENRASRG